MHGLGSSNEIGSREVLSLNIGYVAGESTPSSVEVITSSALAVGKIYEAIDRIPVRMEYPKALRLDLHPIFDTSSAVSDSVQNLMPSISVWAKYSL